MSADGHRIRNRVIRQGHTHLLILAHGITTNKDEDGIYTRFARRMLAASFDSIRFDFRGHGDSAWKPIDVTACGEILDFMTVYDWAARQGYEGIHLLATSFGASIALLAVQTFDLSAVRSLVMWNPVINYRNTFIEATVEWGKEFFNQKAINELVHRPYTIIPETGFRFGPRMTVELLLLHPEEATKKLRVPFLIVHGGEDTMVPASDARRFWLAAKRRGQYVEVPGVDHGFEDQIEFVYSVTENWLLRHTR